MGPKELLVCHVKRSFLTNDLETSSDALPAGLPKCVGNREGRALLSPMALARSCCALLIPLC